MLGDHHDKGFLQEAGPHGATGTSPRFSPRPCASEQAVLFTVATQILSCTSITSCVFPSQTVAACPIFTFHDKHILDE